jgi:hypothetical protein
MSQEKSILDYYVNPDEMWEDIKEYYDLPTDSPITIATGTHISNISEKLGFSTNFINYTFKSEMIGDAKVQMIEKLFKRKFKLWVVYDILDIQSHHYEKSMEPYKIVKFKKKDPKTKKEIVVDYQVKECDILDLDKYQIRIKNNPFSYFTRIAWNCFVGRIKKEKLQTDIIEAYQNHVYDGLLAENPEMSAKRQGYISNSDEDYE